MALLKMILKASTASFSVRSSVVNFHFIPSRSLPWSRKQWVSLRWAHQKQNWHSAFHSCCYKAESSGWEVDSLENTVQWKKTRIHRPGFQLWQKLIAYGWMGHVTSQRPGFLSLKLSKRSFRSHPVLRLYSRKAKVLLVLTMFLEEEEMCIDIYMCALIGPLLS